MKHSSFLTIATLGVATLPFLTSCQDEDFGYTAEQISYRTNFDKMFGKASNIPTFDLSTYNLNKMGLQGGPSNGYGTRALGSTFIKDEESWFEVPDNLISWLDQNLPEECKKNGTTLPKVGDKSANQAKGTTNFTLAMPGNDIIIVPIYQGQAGMVWDLYMKNDTYDEKIWSKSEGIMIRSKEQTTGQTAYSNTTVGEAITINNVAFQQMSTGNGDFYVPIYDALKNAGFDPSKEWFSVNVSGVKNTNGSNYTGSGGVQVNWKTEDGGNFSNGSKTINVKNEEVLQTWNSTTSGEMQLRLAIWQNSLNTSAIPTITIQRYQKTNTATDYTWSKLTATDFDNGHTIGKHIKTNAIRINRDQFSGQFELYLKVTTGNSTYADTGTKQSSKAGQMIAITSLMEPENKAIVDATRAEVVKMFGPDEYEIMFLGCEDANKSGSDWDMNDVCFLLIGRPGLPPIIEGEDKYYSKRYLIEDLGSTFDFDFNDIVVDVDEVVCTHDGQPHKRQTATLKHLCGTIPFQIGFGNISSGDMKWFDPMPGNNNGAEQGGVGYTPTGNPYSSLLVTTDNLNGHWDRDNNNIYVRVWPSEAGATPESNAAGSWTDYQDYLRTLPGTVTTFPVNGEYPYIIATDQNVKWMRELITIPANWFAVNPKNDHPQTSPNVPIPGIIGVTGVTLNEISHILNLNSTFQLTATIAPANANDKSVTWTSSNTAVATVSGTGLVTGVAEGTATITVTTTDGSYTASCSVTVSEMQKELSDWGAISLTFTSYNNAVKIPANMLSDIKAGDKIILTISDVVTTANNNNPTAFLKAMDTNWNTQIGNNQSLSADQTTVTFVIPNNSTTIENIKENGIAIQGLGFTITNVTLEKLPRHTLTVNVASGCESMGTVSGSGTYSEGESVTFTATANQGYRFVKWIEDNSTNSTHSAISLSEDKTFTAEFEEFRGTTFTITSAGNGYISKEYFAGATTVNISVTVTGNGQFVINNQLYVQNETKSQDFSGAILNNDIPYTFNIYGGNPTATVTITKK